MSEEKTPNNNFNITKSNYLDLEWISAEDCIVTNKDNEKYIDFTSAIFTANCGHRAVAEAIQEQSKKVIHCYTFDTPIRTKFIEKLKQFLPNFCEKIYLASAGSEVTSWALQVMRNYKKKDIIVHFEGAFHGKTGQAGMLENKELKVNFPTSDEDWPPIRALLDEHINNIAGVMIETYQGWSGRFMPKSYIQNLVNLCKRVDIPVCFDEIQSGFYRTGKKFGYEHYGVIPDLLCLGKSIGGGMPLSALVGREKYFTFNDMSSTHSGHPICCAAGLKALEIYEKLDEKELQEKALLLENHLKKLCKKHPKLFTSFVSTGLLASLMCKSKEIADIITKRTLKRKLILVNTGKESIKIGPPLIISLETLQVGLYILEFAVKEVN